MSQVISFWQKIDSDPALGQKFTSLETNPDIVAFANQLGFSFSLADYEKELEASLNLDKISGGVASDSGPSSCPSSWPTTTSTGGG